MSISTTHRDFILALEGPVNLTKFKHFRNKFHPDLTLYGGKTEGWKKQKSDMETMRAIYQGQRTLASLSEVERSALAGYSDNLGELFLNNPIEFNFADLQDMDCKNALLNVAQILQVNIQMPITIAELKEAIAAYGDTEVTLSEDNVGELETPEKKLLYAQLYANSTRNSDHPSQTQLFDGLVGKSVSNKDLLQSKRKITAISTDPVAIHLSKSELLRSSTGFLRFLHGIFGGDVDASRKSIISTLDGTLVQDLNQPANNGIAYSNTFVTNQPESIFVPSQEVKLGYIVLIACGVRANNNDNTHLRVFQVTDINPDKVVLSTIKRGEESGLPPSIVLDLTTTVPPRLRVLDTRAVSILKEIEGATPIAVELASALIQHRNPTDPSQGTLPQTRSSAFPLGGASAGAGIGFSTVRQTSSMVPAVVDLASNPDREGQDRVSKTVAETDRETLLIPLKVLVNDDSRMRALLPVSKVDNIMCINNVQSVFPVHLQKYIFADTKHLPAFLQLMVQVTSTVPTRENKCLTIRHFTFEGKEFQNVNQLRSAVEVMGLAYDHIISGGDDTFFRDLWAPWLMKLSKFDNDNFCELNVTFLEKEVNSTFGKLAFALRAANLDEKDRQIVKTVLMDAMTFKAEELIQRGLIASLKSSSKPPPPHLHLH